MEAIEATGIYVLRHSHLDHLGALDEDARRRRALGPALDMGLGADAEDDTLLQGRYFNDVCTGWEGVGVPKSREVGLRVDGCVIVRVTRGGGLNVADVI